MLLGVLPGTGAIAAAVCASALRLNVPLAVAGALLLNNPLVTPVLFVAGAAVGGRVLGEWPAGSTATRVVVHTAVGSGLLAVVLSLLGGLAVYGVLVFVRRRIDITRSHC